MRICICVFVPIHLRCQVLHVQLFVYRKHAVPAMQENILPGRRSRQKMFCASIPCKFWPLPENVLDNCIEMFFIILFYHLTFMSISILFFIFTPFFGKVIIVKENYVFCASQQCRSWVSWEGLTKEIFCCRRWFSQILHKLTPFVKSPNIYFSLDTLDHKMGYFCIC